MTRARRLLLVCLGVLSTLPGCYYMEPLPPPAPAPPAYGRYRGPSQAEDEQRAYWEQRKREREYWERQNASPGPPAFIPPPPPGPPPPPPPDVRR